MLREIRSRISQQRIAADIEAIAECSQSAPEVGYSRPTFTPQWARAVDYVRKQAEAVGATVWVDAAGNLHARSGAHDQGERVWLVGSHLDSVPTGGKYDGVTGVVCALEALRAFPDAPLELIAFAEEEGTTFGLGMLGSRAWTGAIDVAHLAAIRNAAGQTALEAGAAYGLDAAALAAGSAAARIDPTQYYGFLEVHPEQGLSLWNEQRSLAVVTTINGRSQLSVRVVGQANHAGSTRMTERSDALAAAAQIVSGVERIGNELAAARDYSVMTVGRLTPQPNAINVIAGAVELVVDLRAQSAELLDRGQAALHQLCDALAAERGLTIEIERTERIAPMPLAPAVVQRVQEAAAAFELEIAAVPSGALHDAAVIAATVPAAMIFVASRDGISHNPAEFSRDQDIAAAARIVAGVVLGLRQHGKPASALSLDELNRIDRDRFVAHCGGFFEHSPWIATAVVEQRPFASRAALHRAMVAAVDSAGESAQLALIRAHPDLVGALADPNLGAESAAEQRSAGLTELTAEQRATFAAYNARYQARFGFPFVICARENKVAAILQAFPERLANQSAVERETALREIAKIARLRLDDAIHEENDHG